MHGYRLGGLERIDAELASGMGVPPSVKASKDYHRDSENVNSLRDLHYNPRRLSCRLLKRQTTGVIGDHALQNIKRHDFTEDSDGIPSGFSTSSVGHSA